MYNCLLVFLSKGGMVMCDVVKGLVIATNLAMCILYYLHNAK